MLNFALCCCMLQNYRTVLWPFCMATNMKYEEFHGFTVVLEYIEHIYIFLYQKNMYFLVQLSFLSFYFFAFFSRGGGWEEGGGY